MSCLTWFPSSSSSISIYSTQPSLLKHKSHFENLNLCDHDIKEFYKIFDLLDNDHDGYLQYYELLIYLNYETTKFSIHIFDVYDYDKVGKMSFYDFVCIIWNFCTIEKISLERFIFDIYDLENHGMIDILMIHQMFKEIYGREFVKNYQIQRTLKGLSQSLRGSTMISAETFHSLCRQNNQILTPVTLLQSKLRILILGINYWKRQTRNRVEICDGAYIPFAKLLKQITEGHRDRVRRASLLEMTYSLTQQLKNSQDDLSIEPTVEIESQSDTISCCFPWSPRKTYPEPLPLPTETAHISSWRISLEEQTKNISKNQEDTIPNMESNINQRPSRSRSSVFEPEEPLDEDVEALLTKQLVSQRKARGRQPKFQPRSNPASDYVDDALDSP